MARTFGVEIEYGPVLGLCNKASTFRKILSKILGDRLAPRPDGRVDTSKWRVAREHCGSEIISPICSRLSDLNPLLSFGKEVRRYQLPSTPLFADTGLHVHVSISDFRPKDVKRLVSSYLASESFLHSLQPEFREEVDFCKSLGGLPHLYEDLEDRMESLGSHWEDCWYVEPLNDKYFALDFHAFEFQGTVEFRRGASTLVTEDVIPWVRILRSFVTAVKKGEVCLRGPSDLKKKLKAPDSLVEWAKKRRRAMRNPEPHLFGRPVPEDFYLESAD